MTARERQALRDTIARRRLDVAITPGELAYLNPRNMPDTSRSVLFGRSFSIGHCQYCGKASRGIACFQHVDLLALDPKYAAPADVAA